MINKNDLLDNLSKIATDAVSSVSGVKEDAGNFIKSKTEHLMNDLELVQREEFDALKAMVITQAEEIKKLKIKLDIENNDT